MIRYSLVLLCLVSAIRGVCCLNYYYALDKKGHSHDVEHLGISFDAGFDQHQLNKQLQRQAFELKSYPMDYRLLSNYAVLLLKAGKTKESLAILKSIQAAHPTAYELAANLGTAYELNGEPEKALKYIELGMKLNPKAHEGSEWIHVAILKTKLALLKDPDYLNNHTVLGLTAKDEARDQTRRHLMIQLSERFPFTPKGDLIVADLLVDLGDCVAEKISIEHAKALYRLAQEYHGDKRASTAAKVAEMRRLRKKYEQKTETLSEEDLGQGSAIKTTGVTHANLVNYPSKGAIEWQKVPIETDSILAVAGYDTAESTEKTYDNMATDSSEVGKKDDSKDGGRRTAYDELIIATWVACCLLLLIGILIILRRLRRE